MSDDKKSGTAVLDKNAAKQIEEQAQLIHTVSNKAHERILRKALDVNADPEFREKIEELSHQLEKNAPSLAYKARTEALFIEAVDRLVEKIEDYIESEAKAEEHQEHEEAHGHGEHNAHPHDPEKPQSAEKTPEEKAKTKLDELRAEIRGETTATLTGVAIGASFPKFTPERDQALKAEQEAFLKEAAKTDYDPLHEKLEKERLEQIRKGTYKLPDITPTISASEESSLLANEGKERLKKLREQGLSHRPEEIRRGTEALKSKARYHPEVTAEVIRELKKEEIRNRRLKAEQTQLKGRISTGSPSLFVSSKPVAGKILMGSMSNRLASSWGSGEDTASEDSDSDGNGSQSSGRRVKGNPRSGAPSQGSKPGTPQNSRGGNPSQGSNTPRGGLGNRNTAPPRNIVRGGLGGGKQRAEDAAKKAAKRLAAQVAKRAAAGLLTNPYVWIAIAIILGLLFVVYLLVGDEVAKQAQRNAQCNVATETLTVGITGPTDATAGQIVTYEVKVADTVPDQEITIVATIPQEFSTDASNITSSWTKYTLTGNTITWKATENLPPNSLAPPNITFTVALKADKPSTNAILEVDATPTRTAPAPVGGGGAVAGGEKSTEELMAIYGRTPAEVEANLVTIDFQGKQVQVHKLVQGAFEKVNAEITAANTGYAFRRVGTYNWRNKNGGGSGLSTHSFGTTMDINDDTNPYTTADTHDIPPAVSDAFKRNGFAWGGDWQPKHDWMHFQYEGEPGAIAPGTPGGGGTNCPPGGAGGPAVGYVPPSADTCGGRYKLNSSLRMNFGDPQCNFNKDALYTQLQQEDPANADVWFNKVVPCESGYNPNAYAGPQTGTPDARGAWGLYQMGSANPAGAAPPAPGKNGINDRGDVPWNLQTTNATTYGKKISRLGAYWSCAR
ncbi:MAG: M15 family metallopeptidase [Candidatus Levybacteria bacterium]|nr:M15 family metallopeptidase [Candidatus Levybacteria bacterium]